MTARAPGHCTGVGEDLKAQRTRFRGAAGGHRQRSHPQPTLRLPLDAGSPHVTSEGANSADKRPVEPHFCQNASSFRSVSCSHLRAEI